MFMPNHHFWWPQEKAFQIPFLLQNQSDLVVLATEILPLGKVMADQWATKADAKVSYHTLSLSEDQAKCFTLERSHKVVFIPTNRSEQLTVHNVGCKENASVWAGSARVLWNVRWGPKGLTPIRPQIRLSVPVSLQPGQAFLVSGSA